jgi:transposase
LLEVTGHYHRALLQYLQEFGISDYVIYVQRRQAGLLKTDKRDALSLANHLYNQLEKGIQVAEPLQVVRRLAPPSAATAQLRGMIHHRDELIAESTQCKNKLTAICDELFPEFTRVLKNPNLPVALAIRERFPTPAAVARASTSELSVLRKDRYPSPTQLTELQQLAQQSIGTKDAARVRGLVFEQKQLIEELSLIHTHVEQLETEITQIVEQSREGKILTSIPGVGTIPAVAIFASIGSIANFQSAPALKAYFDGHPLSSNLEPLLTVRISLHVAPAR